MQVRQDHNVEKLCFKSLWKTLQSNLVKAVSTLITIRTKTTHREDRLPIPTKASNNYTNYLNYNKYPFQAE